MYFVFCCDRQSCLNSSKDAGLNDENIGGNLSGTE